MPQNAFQDEWRKTAFQDDCSVAHETTVLVRSEKDDVVAASKDGTLQQRRRPERPPRIKDTAPDSWSKGRRDIDFGGSTFL